MDCAMLLLVTLLPNNERNRRTIKQKNDNFGRQPLTAREERKENILFHKENGSFVRYPSIDAPMSLRSSP